MVGAGAATVVVAGAGAVVGAVARSPLPGDPGSSTLDLLREDRYLLLTGPGGEPWLRAAHLLDPHRSFLDARTSPTGFTAAQDDSLGIGDRGATLVRPDHVIAWRADDHEGDPAGRLSEAVWRALTRRPA